MFFGEIHILSDTSTLSLGRVYYTDILDTPVYHIFISGIILSLQRIRDRQLWMLNMLQILVFRAE